MKIVVIGATGRIGKEIVSQGLERGHTVTALARSPEKLTIRHERLIIRKADAASENDLSQSVDGQDAIFSALGPVAGKSESNFILRESARAVIQAMKTNGARRILFVSASLLFSKGLPGGPLVPIIRYILRAHLRDAKAMEEIAQASGLDWTVARPPRLTDKNESDYRSRVNAFPVNGSGTLARKAVAKFMLDALEQKKHIREIVGVAR